MSVLALGRPVQWSKGKCSNTVTEGWLWNISALPEISNTFSSSLGQTALRTLNTSEELNTCIKDSKISAWQVIPRKSKILLLSVISASLLDVLTAGKGRSTKCPYLKSSAVLLPANSTQTCISDTASTVCLLRRQTPAPIPSWLEEKLPLAAPCPFCSSCNFWAWLWGQGRGFTWAVLGSQKGPGLGRAGEMELLSSLLTACTEEPLVRALIKPAQCQVPVLGRNSTSPSSSLLQVLLPLSTI